MVTTQQIKQIRFQTFCCPTDLKPVFKFRMEQLNYSQNDLVEVIGLKSRASEILNRKRKLTLDMIRKLNEKLSIPTEVLIQAY